MPTPILERVPLKQLLQSCTVKLLSSPSGRFLGTGFFVTPDKIATCHHVFFAHDKAITPQFSIEGYLDIFTLEGHTQHHPGLDLLVIQLDAKLNKHCINLEPSSSKEGDRLWAWTFNTKYTEGGDLVPILRGAVQHQGHSILRIMRDIVEEGSSGTPVLNIDTGHLLGVVYWKRDDSALIIPALYFQQHFPDLYTENQNHHQSTTYWAEAQQHSRPQRTKRLTLIPPIDNRDVIGRSEDLATLRQRLQDSHKVLLMNGIGGIGKTTLAKLYLNNYAEEYEHLLWLEQTDDLVQTIATNTPLLRSLGLEQLTGLSPQELFQQVMLSLQNFNEGLNLLVIDNATQSLRPLKDSLPHGPHWHVLLTSREQISTSFELFELGTLEPAAALELFHRHCHKPQDEADLLAFLAQLQYHTLSIELFAKILDNHWQLDSVAELSDYLRHNQIDEDILQTVIELEHAKGETQLYRHLLSAFDLSGLSARPELILILQRMAALPPSAEGYAVKDLVEWFNMEDEATNFVNHLQELFKLGWLTQGKRHYFGLHRLIALIMSKVYPTGLAEVEPLVEIFTKKLVFDQTKDNPISKFRWVPFGQILLEILDKTEWSKSGDLYYNLGIILIEMGDYNYALELLNKALMVAETNLGEEHQKTARRYSALGLVLQDIGDYQSAKILLEKAVFSDLKNFGEDHSTTAVSFSNLAMILKDLEDYMSAKFLLEKALASNIINFGLVHPATANSYSNLAVVLNSLGNKLEAKTLLEKASTIDEKHFGDNHPTTISGYSNLAIVLQELGDKESARELLKKVMIYKERQLGQNHPGTAFSYVSYGTILAETGEYEEALKMYLNAHLVLMKHFASDHPSIKSVESSLKQLYQLVRKQKT